MSKFSLVKAKIFEILPLLWGMEAKSVKWICFAVFSGGMATWKETTRQLNELLETIALLTLD